MWRVLLVWVVGLAVWGFGAGVAAAGELSQSDYDHKYAEELRVLDSSAVPLLEQANRARDANDHATAERLYAEVFQRAPSFFHAERRRCRELGELGRREEALTLCRDAAEHAPTATNLSALAMTLLQKRRGESPLSAELDEAGSLLERAEQLDSNDFPTAMVRCQLAIERRSDADLQRCLPRVEALGPNEPSTAWLAWLGALSKGDFGEAEDQIERARKSHAPAAMVAEMERATSDSRPWTSTLFHWTWRVLAVWAVLSASLVLLGMLLSHLTLRTAESWSAESAQRTATLRRIYSVVLFLASGLYYVSLPLVLLSALGAAAALIYGMFVIGWVPIKLALVIVLMVFATGAAIVRSVLFRPSDEDPGVRVELDGEHQLRATLDEVAAHVGTRPVDTVYMTPDTNLAVFERKGGERCLLIGAGVLERMPLDAFKAILAHEYGHFSNRDTAGGGFALGVRRSLLHLLIGIARSGNAVPWNPAWWFATGFYRLFLRISQGASRLQEILADRRAAEVYGGAAFATGLKHVVACSLTFEDHVNGAIHRAIEAKEPLRGLWSPPETAAAGADENAAAAAAKTAAEHLAEALARTPSPYDSHPAPNDRIRWIERVTGKAQLSVDPTHTAWSLFSDRGKHEREMTLFVQARLAEQGVRLPALPKE